MSRIAPISKTRLIQLQAYEKLKRPWLKLNCKCVVCGAKARDLHHSRGRIGILLLDVRFWMALCRKCHDRVKQDVPWARMHNLLPPMGYWNSSRPINS